MLNLLFENAYCNKLHYTFIRIDYNILSDIKYFIIYGPFEYIFTIFHFYF